MRTLVFVFVLSAFAAPAIAMEASQAAPMTEPPPRMVVRSTGEVRRDRTARPPAMGLSTHAIMMPSGDTPRRAPSRGAGAVRTQPSPKSPS